MISSDSSPLPARQEFERLTQLGRESVARWEGTPSARLPRAFEPEHDVFAEARGLPDLDAGRLDADVVASALLFHGGLVVRGLLDGHSIERLRAHLPSQVEGNATVVTREAAVEVLTVYRPYRKVLTDYLGEAPVSAFERTRIKRDTPRAGGLRWHQDAPLFGGERRALNFWTALTPVGEKCPGLSLVPRRVAWMIAPDYDLTDRNDRRGEKAVEELEKETPVVSPVLEPGDAVLFDEMTVHRTQAIPYEVPYREVAITWFFAPSRLPATFGLHKPSPVRPLALVT